MITDVKGNELSLGELYPYMIFEDELGNKNIIIWTKKSIEGDEAILLNLYPNATPNRWIDSMSDKKLLSLMEKVNHTYIYLGRLHSSIYTMQIDHDYVR